MGNDMDNDSYISFTGESGNKPNISLEIAEKYCKIEEHIDATTDGKYKMYGFNPDINKKCYDEEKQNGTKKGRISTYLLKYKNARFKVVIKSLGAILGITIGGIIYYYVKNTRNQLVPVISEGGGGGELFGNTCVRNFIRKFGNC